MNKHAFLSFSALVLISFYFVSFGFAQGYSVGDEAMNFSLLNVDNNMVSMTDDAYADAEGFIVIFTCNHCPFSVAYEDRIIELDKKFKSQGWPVIAINPNDEDAYPDDSYPEMKVRAKEKGFTFPYLRDESQEIARAYGALKTPHVYVVEKSDDRFVVRYIGAIDDSARDPEGVSQRFVEQAIGELKAGEAVSVSSTKAIGCSVKYKPQ
jgi:peroxiredoxin